MASTDQRLDVNKRLEQIFSQAAGLSQAGRMKSEVWVMPNEIFLINGDLTVMMRFEAPGVKNAFAFRTDDYDSSSLKIQDGQVSFIQQNGDWERIKTPAPMEAGKGAQIKKIWESYSKTKPGPEFSFHRDNLTLIDESMSHLEISGIKDKIQILQRNIYTGATTRIQDNPKAAGLLQNKRPDFGPVALRTNDFIAMFAFQQSLSFAFQTQWVWVSGNTSPAFNAVVGACLFNEMMEG